ncbi:maleylacetoacetate isomerase [Elongatibacter sediminis]|uniref:Maleylacetoacetate isomerase n=1 Tax=Elongatibacter sediminis TaxID=3119006 RepID=A0AAW9RNI1_9GAMM
MFRLHTYWRSSSAYRVRIALNLKALDYESVATHLAAGEQNSEQYLATHAQGLVPALEHDGTVLVQSLAIIGYLDRLVPEPPLYPADLVGRARVEAMCHALACDIQPLNNLRVLQYLKGELGQDADAVKAWYGHWIHQGFRALETWASEHSAQGRFVYGDAVTAADCCLVPQVYNARRFDVPLDGYPVLRSIDEHLRTLPAFVAAAPENQPDAGPA